ncbi:MAG: hypothetical protein A2Y62_12605 [Candidatus Fischerbacteria bacterium RBG_13_37_8]|uniref:Putative regulatory protein FmdB zinc ribbon domain-containing protein n=1 Tax=Candidatus Fischerbacteria bacterium RBG_13_37_8 TaxID=1817863 RepID=A0A1F5VUI1_9BACT|nr:MAG: hypothetical protein A2Y62_12605 [Candidatus Fischerbacteria bacterium RBG_13_37_8]
MPLYEYECKKCKFRIEKIQKITDPPLQYCEKCHGPLRKLLSSPSIRFKGTGWYVTDYAQKESITSQDNHTPVSTKHSSNTTSSPPPSHTSPDKSSLP